MTSGAENSLKGEYAIPVGYGTRFKEKCLGCIVFGSEKHGMVLCYLLQLLDSMPSCEDDDNPYLAYSPGNPRAI